MEPRGGEFDLLQESLKFSASLGKPGDCLSQQPSERQNAKLQTGRKGNASVLKCSYQGSQTKLWFSHILGCASLGIHQTGSSRRSITAVNLRS